MEISDLDGVVGIEASSLLMPWSRQSFEEELKSPHSYCFSLKQRKNEMTLVIGFICFRIVEAESEILTLAIHPQVRQKGLGKHLMRFYIDFCEHRRVRTFYLETGVSNEPAIRLYRSMGYQSERIRKNFYKGTEDALLMVRRASSGS